MTDSKLIATSKPGTLLHALMIHNGLGRSGNKRAIQGGVIKVNGMVATDPNTPIKVGDTISVGKHSDFQVDKITVV